MKVRVGVVTVCCLVALIIGGVALAERLTSSSARHDVAATPIVIDPAMGETFTPEPVPTDGDYLSADEVWQKWDHEPLPSSIPASFGALTKYTGPQGAPGVEVKEKGTPVWAFQERGCMGPLAWRGGEASTFSPIAERGASDSCTTWSFFNAKTGEQIDTYSVRDSPTASTSSPA